MFKLVQSPYGGQVVLLGGQAEPFESLIIIDTCLIVIAKFYLGEEISLLACFMDQTNASSEAPEASSYRARFN